MKPLRILVVEGNPADLRLLTGYLRGNPAAPFEVVGAPTLREALEFLPAGEFAAVLLDLNLPDSSGLAGIDRISACAPTLPIIAMAGSGDAEMGLRALSKNAQDYLVKGKIDGDVLARSIGYAVERSKAQEEARRQNIELDRRTSELQTTNATLHDSRLAALNLMEDAVESREQAEQALAAASHAKQEWETTFNTMPDLVAILDDRHRVARVNQAMARKLGRAPEDCVGIACFEVVHGCDGPPHFCPHSQTLKDGKEHTAEVHEERLGGDYLVTTTPLRDAEGRLTGAVHVARDITERKRAEKELLRLNRALRALSSIERALARVASEEEFVAAVCQIIGEDCGYAMVWIGFAEIDAARSIRPVACAGFEEAYLETLQLSWADTERGRGPTGTAIRTGRVCRCANMLTDPRFAPWRAEALQRGYASSIALPLLARGRAFGALTLYDREPAGFAENEVKLLTDLATDTAQGILALRTSAAKERAELAVRESEERYRTLFATMTEGFALHEIICDREGKPCDYRFLDINPAFERMTGLKRDMVIGKTVLEILPHTEPIWIERYGRVALTGAPEQFEHGSVDLGRFYEVNAYSTGPGRFAVVFDDVTALRAIQQQEKDAAVSLARGQAAVDTINAMGEGVLLLDMKGRIQGANPALERMTGISRTETIGRPVREYIPLILPAEEHAMIDAALRQAASGAIPALPPIALIHRAGGNTPVVPAVRFVLGADNRPAGIVVTLRDISDIRTVQKSLEESNTLLERIFDDTHLCIVCVDAGFNFIRVNRAYATACGQTPAFFQGKNHFALYPDAENEAVFRRVLETGEPFAALEKPFEFPDHPEWGVSYWDWTVQPLRSVPGAKAGLLFCLLDVTQRVQARQNLVKSERKYRELVENANSLILRITPDHIITFFNEYAQKFFGFETREILGRNALGAIIPEVDSEGRDLRELTQAIAEAPELHAASENENLCKDGRRVWVHWANRAIRDNQGRVMEILCVGVDITQRRELEATARGYQQKLRELTKRLAVAEEEERWRIARYIHDTIIQNLSLSSLRLGVMAQPLTDAKLTEEADKMRQVRGLLEQAIDECRMVMSDLSPPLLYELGLIPALNDLAQQLQEKHGARVIIGQDGPEQPLSNPLRGLLFESVRELVMNALKHAGSCEIRVTVSCGESELALRVADTGAGFDPFAKIPRPDRHGGFGLFNIRQRVEGLGGRLEIESTPGKGTTAAIHVPMEEKGAE